MRIVSTAEIFDDPMWGATLKNRLAPYIPYVRHFWGGIESYKIQGTGVFKMPELDESAPPGLMVRVTNTPSRSPIKYIQVFPFIPASYLPLVGIRGGASRMISRVCAGGKLTMDEFTVVEKHNLPSTYHQGQILAFIPTDMYYDVQVRGKWVYLTRAEMEKLLSIGVPKEIRNKLTPFVT